MESLKHTYLKLFQPAGIQMPMDKALTERIRHLIKVGYRDVREVKRALEEYVCSVLFPHGLPARTNRRFFPLEKDVRNCMSHFIVRIENPSADLRRVGEILDSWRKDGDMYSYRPSTYGDEEAGDKLLIVHQTKEQRYLLSRYGNEICLIDATHNITRYAIPLYMIAVKTNVDFQVVGQFFTENETQAAIEEALTTIKSWNPAWNPRHFMSDNDQAQIGAIESVFQGKLLIFS
jgi:hypothetical protein